LKFTGMQIRVVISLVLAFIGLGLASPVVSCNCFQHKSRSVEQTHQEQGNCCLPPAGPSPADCPCGDDCNPALQAQGRDVIVSFYGNNAIPALESGRGLSLSFESGPSESSLAAPFSSRHGPPAESIYLHTTSLRC
jgi:hypothetical protein